MIRIFIAVFVSLSLSSCATSEVVVSEVLNYTQCQSLPIGIKQVTFDRLLKIRGARMLTDAPTQAVNEASGDPDEPPKGSVLIAAFKGRHPTPGYAFELLGAEQQGEEILVRYRWQVPEPGAVLPQMITSPCSVVSLDNMQNDMRVSVWVEEAMLGRIDITLDKALGTN